MPLLSADGLFRVVPFFRDLSPRAFFCRKQLPFLRSGCCNVSIEAEVFVNRTLNLLLGMLLPTYDPFESFFLPMMVRHTCSKRWGNFFLLSFCTRPIFLLGESIYFVWIFYVLEFFSLHKYIILNPVF